MELTSRKETGTLKPYRVCSVEVPADYSRGKAIQYTNTQSDVRGGTIDPIPQSEARRQLYLLHMKIGGTGELPEDDELRQSFLNDFWKTIYFHNHLCPADIPFSIIMDQFTRAMVLGVIQRKGNNQAAICAAFNEWISRPDVRHKLYQVRDQMYPEGKPKQIPQTATPETVKDYTDEELHQKLSAIQPMAGIKMVDAMIQELEGEIERRQSNASKK